MNQSFTNQPGHVMKNVEWKKANRRRMHTLWYHLYKVWKHAEQSPVLFLNTYICSKSIKTCMRTINTIFRIVLTSEKGGNGLTQGNTTVFRMSYVLKCFF